MDFRVLSVLVALWALPAAAQTVVDGDTIKLERHDVPDLGQGGKCI